jgi:outer membrane protein assembly factor BamE
MSPKQSRSVLALALVLATTAGCSVYRQEIRQGNFLSDSALARIEPGMSRAQVEFLLGKPMVADPFHPDRWDFVYLLDVKGAAPERRHLIVLFDGDLVREIKR